MALVGIGFGAAAIASATRGEDESEVYREALVAPHVPLSLDPLVGRADPAVRDVGALLYRRLLRLDSHASPSTDLAQTWGVSGDGLSYRFTLRSGLRWSDGSPLGVADVLATVALVQGPGFPDSGLAATWQAVAATSDAAGSVTFSLKQPRASFAAAAADLPILPAKSVRGLGAAALAKAAATPMPSSGPFRVTSADRTRIRMVPNRYAEAQPQLKGVDLRLMRTFDAAVQSLALGQVDGVAAGTPAQRAVLARLPGVRIRDSVTFRFVDLVFNERRPGLNEPAVRRAIATAVDRRQLIKAALHGIAKAQVGAVPAGIGWIAAVQQDVATPALSARALDAAGWTAGPDGARQKAGQRLAYTLTVPDAAPLPSVAGELARQMRDIGVLLTVNVVRPDSFEPTVLMPAGFDMVVADWDNGPDPDISSFWRSNATPPHGFNVSGGAADPFLDRALDSLATVSDMRLRRAAASDVEAHIADDTPAVFLYAPETSFAVAEDMHGVTLPTVGTSAARFESIATWRKQAG